MSVYFLCVFVYYYCIVKARYCTSSSSVDSHHLAHGSLDVEGPDVLPTLLQERNQEVDGHGQVLSELLLVQLVGTESSSQHEGLLQLESNE